MPKSKDPKKAEKVRPPLYSPIKPGECVRLSIGTFGESDYVEVRARKDGQGFEVRCGEGRLMILGSSSNVLEVRRALHEGDPRVDPLGLN